MREPSLFGVTDGKAVGTYFEHKFRSSLRERYDFEEGSSASRIDFPELEVDMKVTSILNILHTIFVSKERTVDFQTTTGLRQILENRGNKDDILAFLEERRLPVEEISASALADEILANPPMAASIQPGDRDGWFNCRS